MEEQGEFTVIGEGRGPRGLKAPAYVSCLRPEQVADVWG